MANEEIKRRIRESRVYQYEVADALGVSDITFCKWLRKPLTPERERDVLDAIQRLKSGAAAG